MPARVLPCKSHRQAAHAVVREALRKAPTVDDEAMENG
jgi:hypothetical protein